MSKEIDELVAAQVAEFSDHPRAGCWASKLDPEPTEYVAKLKTVEGSGRKVRRDVIQATLRDRWGVKLTADTIRKHLNGNCSCE